MPIINARTGDIVANAVEIADTRASRRRGLLGRNRLDGGSALILTPCCAIHTAFMRFAIDVVFVARDGRVLRILRDLPPWRMALAMQASSVIELAAGSLRRHDMRLGDRVALAR